MRRASLALLLAIQLGVFLAVLGLGVTGLVSGEAAGCAAIVAWFAIGLPASYAAADGLDARLARRRARGHGMPATSTQTASVQAIVPP